MARGPPRLPRLPRVAVSAATIPALSLWQPWAYAVCHLGKRIENRSAWHEGTPALAVARRLVGTEILIHAAQDVGNVKEFDAAVDRILDIHRREEGVRGMAETYTTKRGGRWVPPISLPRMALVGRAILADVVMTTDGGHRISPWSPRPGLCRLCGAEGVTAARCPKADTWAVPGIGLVLADVVPLAIPIRYAGRQGWFHVPTSVLL